MVKIKTLFPPMSAEEQAIRLLLIRSLIGGHIVFGLIFALFGLSLPNVAIRYGLLGVGFCISGIIALALYRYDKQQLAKITLLGFGFAVITLAAVLGGGIHSLAFLDYIGLALMAGILYGEMASIAVAFVSLLLGLGFVIVEYQIPSWPLPIEHTPLSLWISYLFILPMVVLLQYLLTYGVRRAVQKADEELVQRKQAETHFRQLLDATPNALIVVNQDGVIELCNRSTEKLFGYSIAELVGQPIEILVPLELQIQHLHHRTEYFDHPSVQRIGLGNGVPGVNQHGESIFLEVWLEPLASIAKGKILVSVIDITERRKAEDTRKTLLEISQRAIAAETATEILNTTMNALRKSLRFDYLGLRLVKQATGELLYVSSTGDDYRRDVVANWTIDKDKGLAGAVARDGIPECVNNAHLDPRSVYPPGFRVDVEHAIYLPLKAESRVFGVLLIARYADPPFNEEEFELAKMYLSHVTLAIYNAHLREIDQERLRELEKLYQEIQGQKERLEESVEARTAELQKEILERRQIEETLLQRNESLTALHKVSLELFNRQGVDEVLKTILIKATDLLKGPYGYIAVIEDDYLVDWATIPENLPYTKVTRKIEEAAFYLRTAIYQKIPLQIDDYSNQPGLRPETAALGLRASLIAPILGGQKVMGLFGVFHVVEGKTFGNEDLQTLALFAQLAALALDNANLHAQEQHEYTERKRTEERLRQNVEHLSLIHRITLDLLPQRNIETLQQMIVDQISLFLDVDWGVLTLLEGELLVDCALLSRSPIIYERVISRRDDDPSSPIWEVIDKGEPFITENYSSLDEIRPATAELGLKAAILLPVFMGNTCQGILGTGRINSSEPFDREEIQFGILLARIAGIILENAYLHETLRQEAIRDPLTNLFNRRFMEESLTRELQRAARLNHPMAVVMLDIDHFKIFNDTYGHSAGDEVLRRLAEILNESIRLSDIACRYGGEEFVLILPDLSAEAAYDRMERLRENVSYLEVYYQEIALPAVTISIGIVGFPADGDSYEALLLKADQALYRAKNAGRNRVVCFS